MQQLIIVILLSILVSSLKAQNNSTIKEYDREFKTYPYSDPDPIPTFELIYPYYRFDGYTNTPIDKNWKVVELENEYIKVMILPEIGRLDDPHRDPDLSRQQHDASRNLGVGSNSDRANDARAIGDITKDEAANVRGKVEPE